MSSSSIALIHIRPDNPYIDLIRKHMDSQKTSRKSMTGSLDGKRTEVVTEGRYTQFGFVMMQKKPDVFDDLSSYTCKLLVYIICQIELGAEKVKIVQKDTGMTWPTFSKAMVELYMKNVLKKVNGKKEWYWLNLTLIMAGYITEDSFDLFAEESKPKDVPLSLHLDLLEDAKQLGITKDNNSFNNGEK